MYRGSNPRIFPIIVVILVVALVIAAIVSIGRLMFTSGNTGNTETSHESLATAVLKTDADRGVRWTVRGPIIADEKFKSYQITVTPSKRTYTIYSGYLDQVISTQSYGNNTQAYEQLVYALDKAGISTARNTKDTDLRGVCATKGLAYTFETLVDDKAEDLLWSSTCPDSKGTMAASAPKIHALFVNQIPDFQPSFNDIY